MDSSDLVNKIRKLFNADVQFSAHQLDGDKRYDLLVHGPSGLMTDVLKLLNDNQIGGMVFYTDKNEVIEALVKEKEFDFYVYHSSVKICASNKDPAKFIATHKSEKYKLPEMFEAVTLKYGVGSGYSESTVQTYQEMFEEEFLKLFK